MLALERSADAGRMAGDGRLHQFVVAAAAAVGEIDGPGYDRPAAGGHERRVLLGAKFRARARHTEATAGSRLSRIRRRGGVMQFCITDS